MRYLRLLAIVVIIALISLMAAPAIAAPAFCSMSGPHNCVEQSEDKLMTITQNTIRQLQLTQEAHPFRTANDDVLESAVRGHARLSDATYQSHAPLTGTYNPDQR